jgi:hypothetical protein
MMILICNPSYSEGRSRKIMSLILIRGKLSRPYHKDKIKTKGLRHMTQVEECTLCSIPSSANKLNK